MTSKKKPAVPVIHPQKPNTLGVADTGQVSTITPAQQQIQDFEKAIGYFTQRRYQEAMERFEQAARGPAPHVSDKARTYVQVCARKTAHDLQMNLKSADDFFNYGVERLNARDVEEARVQFSKALELSPDAEYILYTMALACGLAGDGDGAYENLKRAIELEPKNRILARQDPEFAALAQQIPLLRSLLQPNPSAPF